MSDNFEERLRAALHANVAGVEPPEGLWAQTQRRMTAALGPRHLAKQPRRTVVLAGAAAMIAVVAVAALARGHGLPTAAQHSPSPLVVDSVSPSPYPILVPPTPSPAASPPPVPSPSPAASPAPSPAPSPSPARSPSPGPKTSPRPSPAASPSPAAHQGPVVTAISPATGRVGGGTTVGIAGAGFSHGPATVMFGQSASPEVAVDSDGEIIAIAPPHAAGQVPVTVQVAGVPSNESGSALFTFVPGP
ncbi:MAG TPA: IPT/TIG domain-containing protein [Actinomycetota bacterium]|nr:IPT/TIG domain-containing protein [Actinomycetota bacterium]